MGNICTINLQRTKFLCENRLIHFRQLLSQNNKNNNSNRFTNILSVSEYFCFLQCEQKLFIVEQIEKWFQFYI